jgi:hypothetical protein
LASSQRGQQQQPRYPFTDAAKVRGLGGARATANAVNNSTTNLRKKKFTMQLIKPPLPATVLTIILVLQGEVPPIIVILLASMPC